ncbi:MAG: hypothetical protein GY762_11740, partial [Proteobacteria bacterium]|nr:hypothetical protein [Pseudomonadota bacterium]
MNLIPNKTTLKNTWDKYALIVIGNIVFFILLYFISYRPHNEDSRAAEFLSLAQEQETYRRDDAALVIYEKVIRDYPTTSSYPTAKQRFPIVKKRLQKKRRLPPKPEQEKIPPTLDIDKMLDRQPSVYLASFFAKNFDLDPTLKPKLKAFIKKYLWIATNHEGIGLGQLKNMKEFQSAYFQQEIFAVKPKCVINPDWIYDNFSIENTNFFRWHNAHIKLTVSQGDKTEKKTLRIPSVASGESVDMLEFRVKGDGEPVLCKGEFISD